MVATPTITEEQFARQVIDLATTLGWRVFRVENSTRIITRRSGAQFRVRNVNPQGVGYPDLTMVRARDARLLFVELKRGKRTGGGAHKVTPEQEAWLADLERVMIRDSVHWTTPCSHCAMTALVGLSTCALHVPSGATPMEPRAERPDGTGAA